MYNACIADADATQSSLQFTTAKTDVIGYSWTRQQYHIHGITLRIGDDSRYPISNTASVRHIDIYVDFDTSVKRKDPRRHRIDVDFDWKVPKPATYIFHRHSSRPAPDRLSQRSGYGYSEKCNNIQPAIFTPTCHIFDLICESRDGGAQRSVLDARFAYARSQVQWTPFLLYSLPFLFVVHFELHDKKFLTPKISRNLTVIQ